MDQFEFFKWAPLWDSYSIILSALTASVGMGRAQDPAVGAESPQQVSSLGCFMEDGCCKVHAAAWGLCRCWSPWPVPACHAREPSKVCAAGNLLQAAGITDTSLALTFLSWLSSNCFTLQCTSIKSVKACIWPKSVWLLQSSYPPASHRGLHCCIQQRGPRSAEKPKNLAFWVLVDRIQKA